MTRREQRPAERAGQDGAGEGGETMTDNQIKEFELVLYEFVTRAANKNATAEEVEALPAVAAVLAGLIS